MKMILFMIILITHQRRTATDDGVITITVLGDNDDVTAVNDYGVVTEDATLP